MSDVAVIGHGKTPEGKGWGKKIDACDKVVRMWDWEWQCLIDYGEKYDFGFLELSPKQWRWFDQHNERHPSRAWVASVLKPFEWTPPIGQSTVNMVTPERWAEIGLKLGGIGTTGRLKLTRGCVAAAWALGRLNDEDRLILVGFDNVYYRAALSPEEGFSETYRKAPSTRPFKDYVGGGTKYHNHDYIAEGAILEAVAREHDVTLVHAQDIW